MFKGSEGFCYYDEKGLPDEVAGPPPEIMPTDLSSSRAQIFVSDIIASDLIS